MKKSMMIVMFVCGLVCGFAANKIIKSVKAEVAGMDYFDLQYDYDFQHAVEAVIEDCRVDGERIRC